MKKSLLLALMTVFAVYNGQAQDDDVYFVPKKKAQQSSAASNTRMQSSSYEVIQNDNYNENYENDNWYEGRDSGRSVDEYNRRGNNADVQNNDVAVEDKSCCDNCDSYVEGSCTARIVRFHAPGAVIIASPWYWDYYDTYFYDPWLGYSWRGYYGLYNPVGWSFSIGWSYPYYVIFLNIRIT